MSSASVAAALYNQVLGRAADAAGLASATAALDAGLSAVALQSSLATSAEARGDINSLYNNVLGRAADTGALINVQTALSGTSSLSGLQANLAFSVELNGDLKAIYANELGRAPDAGAILFYETALARGEATLAGIRAFVATSDEAKADVSAIYQKDLGRAPESGAVAQAGQYLATGGSLAAIAANAVGSVELGNDVTATYQAEVGHGPNAVELAAACSALGSKGFAGLKAELSELATGDETPTRFASTVGAITPQTVTGDPSGNMFVYDLGHNDALITQQQSVSVALVSYPEFTGGAVDAVITGFNAATDIIELQTRQAANFGSLKTSQSFLGSNAINAGSGEPIVFTSGVALTSSNFRFVN